MTSKMPHRAGYLLALRLWDFTGSALLNLIVWLLLLTYLAPLSFMAITSLKSRDQLLDLRAPLYPAARAEFEYQGRQCPILLVPTETGIQHWALVKPFRQYSEFIDPQDPEAGIIRWEGNWRALEGVYTFSPTFENFVTLWERIDFPHLVGNTLLIALIGGLGVVCSSIAVAYGFSRFRIPGAKWLFIVLIATIIIPDSITLLPTYILFTQYLPWNGSWYPLIVPQFFGSAVFIFLLRQNFSSIPRDLDEAAMMDGASPLRILVSVILPQCVPVVTTVSLLHFFYVWNELRNSSLYLGIRQDLRPISFAIQSFPQIGFTQEMLQTSALVVMLVPVVVLFLAQRFFMRDMIVTGLEK